ncbi:BZ3500_MvSof-1268-A1-R1_Chr1-1g00934 [Microbotryum saponariae]|uniref:BZ3500_MvSof-1268-A1-R1_Chr1-1g00934 protein n=1 Tax=Microbotryum saponariae TaxID=289078 RepID=A0A2X0MFL1_9BASI|nr:BZ3500_MvSof-1268-A1-R1_Chr1-1g00934 [Microbotryum saponariae]SCZ92970.1 BZ3501_MvSof-1269-A2-R1_Chr1-1g00531 [Microbotryum saponariae]
MVAYPDPQPGASLLLALSAPIASSSSTTPTPSHDTLLLLSPSRISALRAFAALEAGYRIVVGASATHQWDAELAWRKDQGQIETIEWNIPFDADESAWSHWFDNVLPTSISSRCLLVVLGDTMTTTSAAQSSSSRRRSFSSARAFKRIANERRYLVNIADAPTLSDFTWPTTHRFPLDSAAPSSAKSPLQLALTTNSSACRLATRLRREVVATLPSNVGAGVLAISKLRASLASSMGGSEIAWEKGDSEEVELAGVRFNRPVAQLTREKSKELDRLSLVDSTQGVEAAALEPQLRSISQCRGRARRESKGEEESTTSRSNSSVSAASTAATSTILSTQAWTAAEAQRTRMRYVAQLSEYWPLDRLATVTLSSLSSPSTPLASTPPESETLLANPSQHSLLLEPPTRGKGRIILLGTGPGSPLLLTRLAHLLLTSPPGSPYHVDVFLSDKLVPSEILALIPSPAREGVVIARKYPGNAEHAQDELMRLAVEGAKAGKTVLRLKQGDPFLYGRGGEEVLHFRHAGFEPVVVPGLSSCLAGPTINGIPVTQRGVAETMVVSTGVGRGGRELGVEPYERAKTLVVLMGVARLDSLVEALLTHKEAAYPPYLPIALIERASSPDQRVVCATIESLSDVLKRLSPHRPPGMLVIGWGVMCLEGTEGKGDMTVLDALADEATDRKRVEGWLGDNGYRVREGLGEGWRALTEGRVL